eukprot:scaffold1395_cov244-Pinguiococcus_pyrenoidosus.AAC.3
MTNGRLIRRLYGHIEHPGSLDDAAFSGGGDGWGGSDPEERTLRVSVPVQGARRRALALQLENQSADRPFGRLMGASFERRTMRSPRRVQHMSTRWMWLGMSPLAPAVGNPSRGICCRRSGCRMARPPWCIGGIGSLRRSGTA